MSDHHPYGPSSLARAVQCPGSVVLCADAPDAGGDDANEGTYLHSLVAGQEPVGGMTAEQAELVKACLEEMSRYDAPCGILGEQRMALLDEDFNELSFGTADALIHRPDDIVIIDWKFGRLPVTAAGDNWQMKSYAAMALQASSKERCQVVIFQPRLRQRTDGVFGVEVIEEVQEKIATLKACNENGLMLRYSESGCSYCSAKAECPEYNRRANAIIMHSTKNVEAPQVMANWLDMADVAKKRAEAIRFRATQMMKIDHIEIPGWGLFSKQGKRTIEKAQEAYQRLAPVIGHEAFMAAVKLDIATLEDSYARKRKEADGITLVAARKELAEVLDGVMERSGDTVELRRKNTKDKE